MWGNIFQSFNLSRKQISSNCACTHTHTHSHVSYHFTFLLFCWNILISHKIYKVASLITLTILSKKLIKSSVSL